ncbi:hypothetical protein TNCV_3666621 [Trichonephila clavipes]|nr:hypothetical protein TNCV_3666621 [Trichonephila clavipes]
MLSSEQKEMRVNIFRDLIDRADRDNSFLKKILPGGEIWCFLNNPQIKRQSKESKAKASLRKKREGKCEEATEGPSKMDSRYVLSNLRTMELLCGCKRTIL